MIDSIIPTGNTTGENKVPPIVSAARTSKAPISADDGTSLR